MSDDTHGNNDLNQRMGKEGEKRRVVKKNKNIYAANLPYNSSHGFK
jgi:hypothetical protein